MAGKDRYGKSQRIALKDEKTGVKEAEGKDGGGKPDKDAGQMGESKKAVDEQTKPKETPSAAAKTSEKTAPKEPADSTGGPIPVSVAMRHAHERHAMHGRHMVEHAEMNHRHESEAAEHYTGGGSGDEMIRKVTEK